MTPFSARELAISADHQARLLTLCGIAPKIYGEVVDPSAFTALAIQEAARNGIELPVGVQLGQTLKMVRRPRLGETLRLTGNMSDRRPADRGELVTFTAVLTDVGGGIVLETNEDLLILDAAAPKRASSAEASPTLQVRSVGDVEFRPMQTAEYCGVDVNPIHFDIEAARRSGFRAPIIGGEQGVRHLMALIWKSLDAAQIALSIRFMRPIFWDDRCTLLVEEDAGRWVSVALAKNGKKATEVRINGLAANA